MKELFSYRTNAIALVTFVSLWAGDLSAQTTWAGAPSGRASTTVVIEARVPQGAAGGERPAARKISIDYGQPHARGRSVDGGLIPHSTVWRLGANEATTLTTDTDLRIGNLNVPKGKYTLFSESSASGYTLIVSKQTGQWGTQYDASQDLGRVAMKLERNKEDVSWLGIVLAPTGESAPLEGTLHIRWGGVHAYVPYSVRP